MGTPRKRRWTVRLGLVLVASLVSLGLIEGALRVAGFGFRLYPEKIQFGYPDPKELEDYFLKHDDYMWVQKKYHEKIRFKQTQDVHLALVGCSCTEWGGFDAELVRRVKETPGAPPLVTANLAVSGWSTYQGLQQMGRDVVALEPEVVTIFFGWNDHWMGFGIEDKVSGSFNQSLFYRLQEWRVVQLVAKVAVALQAEEDQEVGAGSRPERVALPDFRSNLRQMVDIARAHDIEPVLITAPTTHKRGEEPGFLGERWIDDLDRLVPLHQAYVEVVREVAAEKDVLLFDLAREFETMPRDEALQYLKEDGIHFTPAGGVKVGELLHEFMTAHDLLPTS